MVAKKLKPEDSVLLAYRIATAIRDLIADQTIAGKYGNVTIHSEQMGKEFRSTITLDGSEESPFGEVNINIDMELN